MRHCKSFIDASSSPGVDALAFMREDSGDTAVDRRGDGDQMLRRHRGRAGEAHRQRTEDEEESDRSGDSQRR